MKRTPLLLSIVQFHSWTRGLKHCKYISRWSSGFGWFEILTWKKIILVFIVSVCRGIMLSGSWMCGLSCTDILLGIFKFRQFWTLLLNQRKRITKCDCPWFFILFYSSHSVMNHICCFRQHYNVTSSLMITSPNGNIFHVTGPLCVRGIQRSPVNSPHKGQWRGALIFSLICAWTNDWVSNRCAGDLRRHRAQYDVTVMSLAEFIHRMIPDSTYRWWIKEYVTLFFFI